MTTETKTVATAETKKPVYTLEHFITEQSISPASVDDIELAKLETACLVAEAVVSCYDKASFLAEQYKGDSFDPFELFSHKFIQEEFVQEGIDASKLPGASEAKKHETQPVASGPEHAEKDEKAGTKTGSKHKNSKRAWYKKIIDFFRKVIAAIGKGFSRFGKWLQGAKDKGVKKVKVNLKRKKRIEDTAKLLNQLSASFGKNDEKLTEKCQALYDKIAVDDGVGAFSEISIEDQEKWLNNTKKDIDELTTRVNARITELEKDAEGKDSSELKSLQKCTQVLSTLSSIVNKYIAETIAASAETKKGDDAK